MNEIITKLNEIEEKAGMILEDARNRKEQLTVQLARDKHHIDEKYVRLRQESLEKLEENLGAEAQIQIETLRRENEAALTYLDETFRAKKEQLADEILERIIGE